MNKAIFGAALVILGIFVLIILNPVDRVFSSAAAKASKRGDPKSLSSSEAGNGGNLDTAPGIAYDPEIEARYPGGAPAWLNYLRKNVQYPDAAANNNIEGTVLVSFAIDKDGNVSNAMVLRGPESGGLREEALRVIGNSGRWKPATMGRHPVKSYKAQPIVFHLK
ncbi:MAG: energy transducer TonB [Puia sp.]|nr:energy transducer TonB [Puia sp.]